MIVECPTCHTRYRVDDALVAGKDPLFQCSLDNYLFKLPPPPTDEEPELTQQENELPFSIPDLSGASVSSRRPTADGEQEDGRRPTADGGQRSAVSGHLPAVNGRRSESGPGPQGQEEPPFVLSSTEWEKSIPLSLRPFFVLLAVLVLSYGVFSLYLLVHPAWTETFLVRLPLVGKVFVADPLSPRKISLVNPEGWYQQIKDNKRVFIISGQALNTAPLAARSIQVEGRIFNGNRREVGKKVIFCGNEVSIKVVENLSTQEISLLQKLVPPKHFGVPPGKTTNFLVIFTDPPADLKEFSCRVIATQYEPQVSVPR